MRSGYVEILGPTDGVVTLRLNNPAKRNALSIEVRDDITDALERLAGERHVKVVVITGAGGTFCSGFDLDEFQHIDEDPDLADRVWNSGYRFHRAMLAFPLPLVAAVNGPAIAGGFDLAVMCDIRVAAESARFEHPERTFVEVVYGPLHDLVGAAVARDLVFTGRSIDAREAHELRLVSRVVPDSELGSAVRDVTNQITHAPREILLRMKKKVIARAGVVANDVLDI
ncbi:MAG: enoyl-CoA hydratase/isomerase family protein [Acidimicrobiia bacterium]|nr:enoyl-CoA hydratase/isomerase family protein [Acidimicrobiia bacterium]